MYVSTAAGLPNALCGHLVTAAYCSVSHKQVPKGASFQWNDTTLLLWKSSLKKWFGPLFPWPIICLVRKEWSALFQSSDTTHSSYKKVRGWWRSKVPHIDTVSCDTQQGVGLIDSTHSCISLLRGNCCMPKTLACTSGSRLWTYCSTIVLPQPPLKSLNKTNLYAQITIRANLQIWTVSESLATKIRRLVCCGNRCVISCPSLVSLELHFTF